MRVTYFKIENFRNISLAECSDVPNLMVICGGNGCGKSAVLNAIMAAKEHAAPYGGFRMDPRSVSANAQKARITLRVAFSDEERAWYQERNGNECPESDEIIMEIQKGGQASVPKRSHVVRNLLSWYSREYAASPGFFDYIDAHRMTPKKELSSWNSEVLSDQKAKESLGAAGSQKFNRTKEYLASLVMKDAQTIMAAKRNGEDANPDSLSEIRNFFNRFFKPMSFRDVRIDSSPFQYIVETPRGEIDIDDLSSGEKEILNTYIHFHELGPHNAVILFDEIDAHLHPELERRYFSLFSDMSQHNQLILTTHSPEIMVAADSESLYALNRNQDGASENQLVRVTDSTELHGALASVMGSNGMVSINKKIVFIEGTEASADRYIYEALFPPAEYGICFMPCGDSSANVQASRRVNELLSATGTFQEFYSIIDGDIERPTDLNVPGRLHPLPYYHVENVFLDATAIQKVSRAVLKHNCPYDTANEVEEALKRLIFEDKHLLPYARALFDAEVAAIAKNAWDSVYRNDNDALQNLSIPTFPEAKERARDRLNVAVGADTWWRECKGRDVIKAYCNEIGVKYEHFRNLLIDEIEVAPKELQEIIESIQQ